MACLWMQAKLMVLCPVQLSPGPLRQLMSVTIVEILRSRQEGDLALVQTILLFPFKCEVVSIKII